MNELPGWIAAIAAVIAAGLVAWQSLETRRSAQASAAAATAANSAIELTRSALEIARTEERHTRRLIIEGIKSRIDVSVPTVEVLVESSVEWPPLEPSVAGGQANPLKTDVVYRLPRDAGAIILVRAAFTIRNEGSRLVVANFNEPWQGSDGLDGVETVKAGKHRIYAGKYLAGYFEIGRTVREWAEIAEYQLSGQVIEEATRTITVSDNSDTGAIDWYETRIGGTPLTTIENEQGGCRLHPSQYTDYERNSPVMRAVSMPRRRVHYLYKSKDLLLDEAFGADITPD